MKRFGRRDGPMDPPVKPEGDGCEVGRGGATHSVIAGLDPAIQSGTLRALDSWMPGSSPGMTMESACHGATTGRVRHEP